MYDPDGNFAPTTVGPRVSRFQDVDGVSPRRRATARRSQVPGFISLESNEQVVGNFKPPYHASKPAKGHSLFANLRDRIVVFAYGRENVLRAPTHVVTNSRQRIVISDPDLQAVHVIDTGTSTSFRIAGGERRRFQSPGGLAIDGDDNIYVADAGTGTVQAFDPEGKFLRDFGTFKGESRFDTPTGIAIDRKSGLLYVLDSSVNELYVFDLDGNLVRKVGGRSTKANSLVYPTEIAVSRDRIVILDDFGARIQILDKDCRFLSSFRIKIHQGPPVIKEIGLSLDAAGRIYLSNFFPDEVAIYTEEGKLLEVFGRTGMRTEEFKSPSGIWIDSANRIYITDTDNSRVQVFRPIDVAEQANAAPPAVPAH